MAIKVIRICDGCGEEHEQTRPKPGAKSVSCSVAYTCSDCISVKKRPAEPVSDGARRYGEICRENAARGVRCSFSLWQ